MEEPQIREKEKTETVKADALPSLGAIVERNTSLTEAEWILLYALYLKEQGIERFCRDDIRRMYRESGRMTRSHGNNLVTNLSILVNKGYIRAYDYNVYELAEAGEQEGKRLIEGRYTVTQKAKPLHGKKRNDRYNLRIVPLGLTDYETKSLREFYQRYLPESFVDRALLLYYWAKENKGLIHIDRDIIYTLFSLVNEPMDFDIYAMFSYAKARRKWLIPTDVKGKYEFSHMGEAHIRRDVLKEK